jgi:PhzF family phenazine biosynthesis protein
MLRRFRQVDVFTLEPLLGNPVAVVLDSEGLSTEDMLAFTAWTNLSEATFVVPPTHPEADYAVRIFCPGRELPFAGHPTLGTCHAWLEAGGIARGDYIVQECGVGLVRIARDAQESLLSFAAPPLRRSGPLDSESLTRLIRGLGLEAEDVLDHSWCDNGPGWQALLLRDAKTVLAVQPDPALLAGLDVGLVGLHPSGSGADVEVRAFFPGNSGLAEDPVTGSLNAALAQWLIGTGRLPASYMAAQGTVLGRAGRVHVTSDSDAIWIGGGCVTVMSGTALI